MTTIAWDGKTLAGDTQVTTGNIFGYVRTKIFRLPDGRLAGSSGFVVEASAMLNWLRRGGAMPEGLNDDNFTIIVIDRRGRPHRVGARGMPTYVGRRQWAIGSGRDFALAAMACGRTAAEAVRVAASFDESTGGRITQLRLRK